MEFKDLAPIISAVGAAAIMATATRSTAKLNISKDLALQEQSVIKERDEKRQAALTLAMANLREMRCFYDTRHSDQESAAQQHKVMGQKLHELRTSFQGRQILLRCSSYDVLHEVKSGYDSLRYSGLTTLGCPLDSEARGLLRAIDRAMALLDGELNVSIASLYADLRRETTPRFSTQYATALLYLGMFFVGLAFTYLAANWSSMTLTDLSFLSIAVLGVWAMKRAETHLNPRKQVQLEDVDGPKREAWDVMLTS